MIGLAVYGVGTVIAIFAQSFGLLLAARAIQGMGGRRSASGRGSRHARASPITTIARERQHADEDEPPAAGQRNGMPIGRRDRGTMMNTMRSATSRAPSPAWL